MQNQVGDGNVAVWNPADNAIKVYGGSLSTCIKNVGAFTVTGDRTLIVLGSRYTGTLCTLNPATGQLNFVNGVASFVSNVAATPDGK